MELTELQALQSGPYTELINKIQKEKPDPIISADEIAKQLDPSKHKVTDKTIRPDKLKKNGDGTTGVVPVARLPIPYQKRIVNLAASFLCGNPIQLRTVPQDQLQEDLLAVFKKTWEDSKLDYESLGLAEMMMGETECAELWYTQEIEEGYWAGTANDRPGVKYRLRMKVLAPSKGDKLYPVYDATGDMIAFGRQYTVRENGKEVKHFDVYTASKIIKGTEDAGAWVNTPEPNIIGKIPVIYYSQLLPEWYDVQPLIERKETSISNNADTNDYFGSPIMTVEGKIIGFADKGESGKVIQLEPGAKAGYLTWPQAPEAIKLELEVLQKLIYDMSDTPNISFDEMKGLGVFSGIALKMLFLSAHLKSARKEGGGFGKSIQRRINYLKAALTVINVALKPAAGLSIKPVFEYYMPKNLEEAIKLLTEAAGPGKAIMSQDSAIAQNPLVQDAEAEKNKMIEEGSYGSDIENA